jgi:hypothetical protein
MGPAGVSIIVPPTPLEGFHADWPILKGLSRLNVGTDGRPSLGTNAR